MPRKPMMLLPLLVLNASLAAAQSTANSDLTSRIDGYAAPFAEAGHLSGTLLVARGEEVIYERSWGLADRERGRPFAPETPSCIASLTKPTTVILTSQLIESGEIALRDPISKWLEDFPNGEEIQFRHLLFHRSGIPHRLTARDEEDEPRTAADMVELARAQDLDFKPGSRIQYSSGGFSVMVRVLEIASGKSYEALLRERILEPLNLSHTLHPGPGVDLPGAAKSYTWSIDGRKPASDKHYSFLIGAGALFSTPRDLLTIARTVIDGGFGERARRQIVRGGKMRWNGITNSYRAFLDYDAKTNLTLILVSNQMVGANDLLRRDVPKIVAGEVVEAPSVPRPRLVSLSEDVLKKYTGQYKIGGSAMPVRTREGALFANDWVLLPISETSFYSPQDYATVSVIGSDTSPEALDWAGMNCPRLGPLAD